jgi:polyisoprenoid-binding protein YceI
MLVRSLVLPFLAAGMLTAAAGEVYKIDTSHAEIGFAVRHLGLSKVKGKFDKFSGSVTLDGNRLIAAEAKVEAASINTNDQKRDDHLRNEDFFAVDKHSAITFASTKVEGNKLHGNLTILGITKPVVLDIAITGPIDHPFVQGGKKIGLSATGKIDRFDFGLTWNKMPGAIGKEVEIVVDLEADKT